MRILLVSQMYPGPDDPDLGAFVAQIERELHAQGHELDRAVIDRRGGLPTKHLRLALAALWRALRFRPDVIFAHFLAPAGVAAALAANASGAPLVLMAHGRDVRNIDALIGMRRATRFATRHARAVIANSAYLRDELIAKLPELDGSVEVIDSGVDLRRFHRADAAEARRRLGWEGEGPFLLFVGTLDERKNVVRLVRAFERLGRGRLALVGDGPLYAALEGSHGVRLVGHVPHDGVAEWIAACEVLCLPSLVEPFGQVLLEAMASERSVVATQVGGPPEFVSGEAGVLVDPTRTEAIEAGLRAACDLPFPNPAARRAAAEHDVRRQAERMAGVLERAAAH